MNHPKKILLDVRLLPRHITGIGRYLTTLVERLPDIAPPQLQFELLRSDDQEIKTRIPDRALSGFGRSARPLGLLQQAVLPGAVQQSQCDLYHYPYYDPPWAFGKPWVATCYDIEPLRHPELFSRKIRWYYRLFTHRLRYAERVIVISEQTKRDLVELRDVDPSRVHVAYLGVEAHFQPITDAEQLAYIRQRYNLPKRFILYVGNTRAHKNVVRLVEALARLQGTYPGLLLVLVGAKDTGRTDVQRAAQRCGVVDKLHFLDRIPDGDLPLLYNAADVFAFPSLYEGFGLPVLEAMACGTPVVTSNRASLPEITGNTGIIIDPYDVGEIASGIDRLLANPDYARRVGSEGFERSRQFTWQRCVEEHITVYRDVLHV